MVFVSLLGHHMCQFVVATSILGASAMLRHAPCPYVITLCYVFLQRYMGVGYSPLSLYILTLNIMFITLL